MSTAASAQLVLDVAALLPCAWPLGAYMARVYVGDPPRVVFLVRPAERRRLGPTLMATGI